MAKARRSKVAIIGGGCASLAAAFELSKSGKYDITVYQQGWRLGGKGASGRGGHGRIEEHALHVWLGFYENAFRMLRECYKEFGHDWRHEFIADSFVGVADERVWTSYFPPAPGLPGDDIDADSNPFTLPAYLAQVVRLLRALMAATPLEEAAGGQNIFSAPMAQTRDDLGSRSARDVADDAARLLKLGLLTTTAGMLKAATLIECLLAPLPDEETQYDYLVTDLLKEFARAARINLKPVVESDPAFRFRWHIIDLVLAILVGAARDRLLIDPQGLDAINDVPCREWLRRNGASEESLQSPFIRGLFNLAFAGEPDIAAGQALRGALRMFFTYRGALFWKMRAGMGDVVFAPLYLFLKKRGVKFAFFHRLEKVRMHFADPDTDDATYVEALEFDIQARVKGDIPKTPKEYDPLVKVKDRWCWPSAPDLDQLEASESLRGRDFESFWDRRRVAQKTLRVGHKDGFDFVVLGISIGGVKYTCDELIADEGEIGERWKAMVENVATTATQSLQVWLKADMQALGWTEPPVTIAGIENYAPDGGATPLPFDTWADMTQVVPAEAWPDDAWPGAVAYFCGPLRDDPREKRPGDNQEDLAYVDGRRKEVAANAMRFLNDKVARLWPGAATGEGFNKDLLAGIYSSANINPSDRYVLAKADTLQHRISPLDQSIDNMTIAGDWTDCGFNEGCVEAAVMSGLLAAHAISGSPDLEDIIGYDHP